MKQLDLTRFVLNEHYSVWPIDFAMSASFEAPLERLQAILPANIHAIETRPGVGLLNLAIFSFPLGTYGLTAPCVEVVGSIHVIPNLAAAPTLPRLSMYTFQLGATTREFIESPFATDHYPVFPVPLRVHIDSRRIAARVEDAGGQPILSLSAAEGVTPKYGEDRFYVQSVTSRNGQTYRAGNLFEFRRAENQKGLATAGAPSSHPFYGGLNVSDITARQCYLQMWSEPNSMGREIHFFLQPEH
jgi:hypothetical protein